MGRAVERAGGAVGAAASAQDRQKQLSLEVLEDTVVEDVLVHDFVIDGFVLEVLVVATDADVLGGVVGAVVCFGGLEVFELFWLFELFGAVLFEGLGFFVA